LPPSSKNSNILSKKRVVSRRTNLDYSPPALPASSKNFDVVGKKRYNELKYIYIDSKILGRGGRVLASNAACIFEEFRYCSQFENCWWKICPHLRCMCICIYIYINV